jgi:hypothetical protein
MRATDTGYPRRAANASPWRPHTAWASLEGRSEEVCRGALDGSVARFKSTRKTVITIAYTNPKVAELS